MLLKKKWTHYWCIIESELVYLVFPPARTTTNMIYCRWFLFYYFDDDDVQCTNLLMHMRIQQQCCTPWNNVVHNETMVCTMKQWCAPWNSLTSWNLYTYIQRCGDTTRILHKHGGKIKHSKTCQLKYRIFNSFIIKSN